MQIAVLGMGRMGRALARRLASGGHDVVVWNRTPGRGPAGLTEAATPNDAVGPAAIVLLALSNDEAVRGVVLRPDGVASELGADRCLVDCSTVSPDLTSELAASLPRFAALPILGGPDAVASGSAAYLLGAPAPVAARLEPVLASLSTSIRRYERPELATAAKLTSNLLLLAGAAALADACTVGRSGGLTDQQLRDLLADSPMVAPGLRNRFEALLTGDGAGWWTITLGAKDAGLAVELARRADHRLLVAPTVAASFSDAAARGLGASDIAAIGRPHAPPP